MLPRALGQVYGALMAQRRRLYAAGLLPRVRLAVPVISVGALVWGGAGKTPLTIYLAHRLLAAGRRVGIVHSGYRGAAGRRTLRVGPSDAGAYVGDEAALLARRVPEAVITRGPDKVAAARLAITEGAELLLLDDGFQHLRLQRALDIVLVDALAAAPLPAGPGREAASAVAAADLRWFHGRAGEAPPPKLHVDVVSEACAEGLVTARGELFAEAKAIARRRVFLLAGIARPEAFRALIEAQGAEVCGAVFVRDHHRLPASALRKAFASRADFLLCTEKDLARHAAAELEGVCALRLALRITRGEQTLASALLRACRCV